MLRTTCFAVACVCSIVVCGPVATAQTLSSESLGPLASLEGPATYSGGPLSLNAAIEEALQKNPSLIARRRELDVVRQRPAQSRFLAPPTVDAQIWQWPINTLNPLNTNMYMLTVGQEIPGRGKRDLRAAVAQKDADLSQNEIAIGARQAIADLKHAYTTLLVARKARDVYGETAKVLRQLADASESKYASGRISQQDVLKPVLALSKLYDDALVSEQQAALASAQLNALMGRSVDALIGPLTDALDVAAIPSFERLTQLAIDHQPELQAGRLAIDRAKAEMAMAKGDAKPDFAVQGGYMITPRGIDAWTGQLSVTWPSAPWSRGRVDARVAETLADVSAAEARLRAAESQLRLAVRQAVVRAKTAEQRAALLQTTILPQSRQTLEASRVGYDTDRLDFLTLLENQRTLLNEQLDYIRVLGDLAEARADVERVVGVDLDSASVATAPIRGGR